MDVPPDELAAEVAYQIGALEVFARAAGRAGVVREAARRALQPRRARRGAGRAPWSRASGCAATALPVLGLPGSRLLAAAGEAGLPAVPEAFADRAYTAGGHAGAARRAGRGDARPGRGRGAGRAAWPADGRGRRPPTAARSRVARPLAVPARRHPGRGRTWPGGSARALEAAGRPGGGLRMRALPVGRPTRCSSSWTRGEEAAGAARRAAAPPRGRATWRRTRDRARGPDGAAGRPRRPGPRSAAELAALGRAAAPAATRGRRSRSRCATTARTSPRSPPCGASPARRSRPHPRGTEFRVAFCGFAPGFGYLTGPAGALDVPAPGHPAHVRPGRLGRPGGPVHRRVPALLPRRLAADRHAPDAVLWDPRA